MDFAYDDRTEQLSAQLQAFMDEHVYPAEKVFAAQVAEAEAAGRIWQRPAVIDELKAEARRQGLWNLFLAHHPAGRGPDQPAVRAAGRDHRAQPGDRPRGAELRRAGHRQHGAARRVRHRASSRSAGSSRCSTATIRSAFCMTEPDVASSDATNIAHPDRARRRRVRDQRPQVVVVRGDGPALRDPHRDGQDRSGRRAAPAAVDDPGAQGHPRGHDQARHAGVRLLRRVARRARRDRVHATCGCRRRT